MRKISGMAILLVLLFSVLVEGASIGIVTDADSDNPLFSTDSVQLEIVRGKAGEAVFVCDEMQWLSRTGEPHIPWQVITVLLPPDVNLSSVSAHLNESRFEQVGDTWVVPPTPPMVAWHEGQELVRWPEDKRIVDGYDADIYERDAFWPQEQIRLLGTGQLHKWQLAELAVPLVRYNPVSDKLMQLTEADVSITFDRVATVKSMPAFAKPTPLPAEQLNQRGLSRVQGIAVNFNQVSDAYGTETPQIIPPSKSTSLSEDMSFSAGSTSKPGYTIITTSAIRSASLALADFVTHKQSLGYAVQVITEADFGGGRGNVAAENIRAWLQANYLSNNIVYVLLIGNPKPGKGDIPMKKLWPAQDFWPPYEIYRAPSDLYYAYLTGNWDTDGDGRYGEWADVLATGGADRYWEVLVGRIPYFGFHSDLDAILQKIIDYETQSTSSVQWRKNVLLPMNDDYKEFFYSFNLGEAIKDEILAPAGWSYHRIYDDIYFGGMIPPAAETQPCTIDNVTNVWKAGKFGLAVWWAHGSTLYAEDVIDTFHVPSLNDFYPAFTFQVSCDNASPTNRNNLAYALLKNGGVCTIGATNLSWYQVGQTQFSGSPSSSGMGYEYTSRLVAGELTSAGEALYDLKQILSPGDQYCWMNFTVHNIYGDPSLHVKFVSQKGYINLNYDYYQCSEEVGIRLADGDLAGRGSQEATLTTSGGDLEPVILTEANPTFGIFTGVISTFCGDPNSEDGTLQLSHGDIITVTYIDSNDGTGNPATATDTALAFEGSFIFHVDADANGRNNGLSWADAFNCLQDALDAASGSSSSELPDILVAEGIYKPDRGANVTLGDRTATFRLINGVAVKGGYAGFGKPDPNARDIEEYETILSGDLNGDDGPNFANNADNSYHVVYQTYCDSTAVLDGFTITAGNANGSYPNYYGGGMYNYGRGAHRTDPTINNCTFIGNYAKRYGGGISSHVSNSTVTNCKFIANSAGSDGGGVYNNSCRLTFVNCIFSGNSANRGGGMHNHISNNQVLINCTFSSNSANRGGGICNDHSATNATLTNCILWGNSDNGGTDESAQIHHSGGVLVVNYGCIQGWTGGFGGTGNHGDDPLFVDPGYWADESDPNIIVGPKDPNAVWIEGNYHLLGNSPCIDTGDPNFVAGPNETDLDGNPRVVDGDNDGNSVVDMGAYERMPEPAELIAWLLEEVGGLELPRGISNSLEAKLNAALGALEDENKNNDIAAINILGAFINAVEAQRGKKIPEAEADALIAAAQEIIELLSDG